MFVKAHLSVITVQMCFFFFFFFACPLLLSLFLRSSAASPTVSQRRCDSTAIRSPGLKRVCEGGRVEVKVSADSLLAMLPTAHAGKHIDRQSTDEDQKMTEKT